MPLVPDPTAPAPTTPALETPPAAVPDEFDRRLAAALKTLGVTPAAPAPAPAPVADPAWERVGRADLEALRAKEKRLAEIETENRQAEEKRLMKDGQWETLLKQTRADLDAERTKTAETARQYKASLRDREILAALAQHPLLPHAPRQLLQLLRDQFDVHDEAGQFVVKSRGFEPVDAAIKAMLSTPEYEGFLKSKSQGGVGAQGGNGTTPTPTGNTGPQPKNYGEAALLDWLARRDEAAKSSVVPGNLSGSGFGGFGNRGFGGSVKTGNVGNTSGGGRIS